MSTTIYKPLGLSFLGNTPDRRIFCRSEVRKVKRVLFEPVDHAATQKFIDEEFQKISVTESKRWNFDFKREKTLDPDGIYNWRPATPQKNIRPIKRPCTPDVDVDELYGRPIEVEITRPIPQRPLQDEEMKSPPKSSVKLQRPITEFMSVKKKTTCSKKSIDRTPSSTERPSKLPRLAEYSS